MANIDKSKLLNDDKELKNNKHSTKVVIITSVDDDDDNNQILSHLNPENIQTIMADLNETNLMDAYRAHNKRSVSQSGGLSSGNDSATDITKNTNSRKRKADLTCVVCGAEAICYNFGQITCESCKAFFRRNALQPIEKTKCLTYKDKLYEIRCNVHHNIKQRCQRCRLLKCFQAGMRKDYILTPEQKQTKKQRLEENRLLRSTTMDQETSVNTTKSTTDYYSFVSISTKPSTSLTESDWLCLKNMQNAYLSAIQSSPLASSVISFELAPDQMSALMNTIDIQNFTAVKLIHFLKEISEFEQLDEHDRLVLVKYNLVFLMVMRPLLTFDTVREMIYDLDSADVISPTDEAFAQHRKSLFILCYGYEFNRAVMLILHALVNLTNKNPIIIQLLMLMMIFSKGSSIDDDQEPILNDGNSVFRAQSKYTDLLFRYLMEGSSFEVVATKMTRITEQLLKIQKVCRDYKQYLQSKVDVNHINPLMKSLLHFT